MMMQDGGYRQAYESMIYNDQHALGDISVLSGQSRLN